MRECGKGDEDEDIQLVLELGQAFELQYSSILDKTAS